MRRIIIFIVLTAVLAGLLIARASLPEPSVPAMADPASVEYNQLDFALPTTTETAGSAMIAEMNAYYLSLQPTEKNAWTGVLGGKHLLLVCADEWTPDPGDAGANPALCRLARESAQIPQAYRPDWFQGEDGRLFALLTGMEPTRVDDRSALAHTAEQRIYLPFSLPRCFAREYGGSAALIRESSQLSALEALGFGSVRAGYGSAAGMAEEALAILAKADAPTLVFCQWYGNGEDALALLMDALSDERRTDTALCLLTADPDPERAHIYLWGAGLSGAASDAPCSELDVVPTLLNLFGVGFDSRFLSGRDIFASGGVPLVTLYGSAFSAWVTDAGRYDPASDLFFPSENSPAEGCEPDYIRRICDLNYGRYIFARRAIEMNYFHLIFSGKE